MSWHDCLNSSARVFISCGKVPYLYSCVSTCNCEFTGDVGYTYILLHCITDLLFSSLFTVPGTQFAGIWIAWDEISWALLAIQS